MSQTNQNQLNRLNQINEVCDQFEDRYLNGESPRIESVLSGFDSCMRKELLPELLRIELFFLQSIGQTPTIQTYYEKFPDDHDSVIKAFDETIDARETVATLNAENEKPDTVSRQIGDIIGSFKIEQILGSGAFAEVYLAFDSVNRRPVAIKAMHRFASVNQKTHARTVQSFIEEAETLSKLDLPHIAQIYDVGQDSHGLPYVVMEFVKGDSLEYLLKENLIDWESALRLVADIAEALSEIHQQHVFHRDLKPANIIVERDGKPRIVDFGLAVDESFQHQRQGEVAGTIGYMSPEQIKGYSHRLDGRADIWSLGVMLYEILAGRLPFRGATKELLIGEILHREPRPIRQINTNVTPMLENVCLKALAKKSKDRYLTADDFCHDLRGELGEFSQRIADLSGTTRDTYKGRAEFRLAAQSRIWNEKPEVQRLPTLWQYLNILFLTEPTERTVGELRMMSAAFGYYAKWTGAITTVLVVTGLALSIFFNHNRLKLINRSEELSSQIANIGNAETAIERTLFSEKIIDVKTAIPEFVKSISSAFESGDNLAVENYLMLLFEEERFSSELGKSQQWVQQIQTTLEDQFRHVARILESPLQKQTIEQIESRNGLVKENFAFCPKMEAEIFDRINSSLRNSGYVLVDFDDTADESMFAAVWHRSNTKIDSCYRDAQDLQTIQSIRASNPVSKFDAIGVVSPDYMSGGDSGLEGLIDFDNQLVSLNESWISRTKRCENELKILESYSEKNADSWHFMKARAHYHLGQYEECSAQIRALENSSKETTKRASYFLEIRALLNARLGKKLEAIDDVQTVMNTRRGSSFALRLNAKVNWLLGEFDSAKEIFEQIDNKFQKAAAYSWIAEQLNKKDENDDSIQEYVASSMELLKNIAPREKKFILHSFDLDFVLKKITNLDQFVGTSELLLTSGKWKFDSQIKTEYTGGKTPYKWSPKDHLKRSTRLEKDGYVPSRIRISKSGLNGDSWINSVWKKQDRKRIRRDEKIEQISLAIVGSIKCSIFQDQKIDPKLYRLLGNSEDPTFRTELIMSFGRLNVDVIKGVLDRAKNSELSIQQALLFAASLYDQNELNSRSSRILRILEDLTSNDIRVRNAIRVVRKKLGITVTQSDNVDPENKPDSNWYRNVLGQNMINVGDFWLADCEITTAQYQTVMKMHIQSGDSYSAYNKATFYNAMAFCNALSQMSGIPEEQWCYQTNKLARYEKGARIKKDYQNLNGYRLPTFEEWRQAYRGNINSYWEHGRDEFNSSFFANTLGSRRGAEPDLTVGRFLPTQTGFFDFGGNAIEWLTPTEIRVVNDSTKIELIGGSYSLTPTTARDRRVYATAIPNNFENTTGIRVLRKFIKSNSSSSNRVLSKLK